MECVRVYGSRILYLFFNKEPEDLFETISQAILNGVDRDASSGWGAIVHVITPDQVITRDLRGRMD
jgi:20S proteasome subunit beta 3